MLISAKFRKNPLISSSMLQDCQFIKKSEMYDLLRQNVNIVPIWTSKNTQIPIYHPFWHFILVVLYHGKKKPSPEVSKNYVMWRHGLSRDHFFTKLTLSDIYVRMSLGSKYEVICIWFRKVMTINIFSIINIQHSGMLENTSTYLHKTPVKKNLHMVWAPNFQE